MLQLLGSNASAGAGGADAHATQRGSRHISGADAVTEQEAEALAAHGKELQNDCVAASAKSEESLASWGEECEHPCWICIYHIVQLSEEEAKEATPRRCWHEVGHLPLAPRCRHKCPECSWHQLPAPGDAPPSYAGSIAGPGGPVQPLPPVDPRYLPAVKPDSQPDPLPSSTAWKYYCPQESPVPAQRPGASASLAPYQGPGDPPCAAQPSASAAPTSAAAASPPQANYDP